MRIFITSVFLLILNSLYSIPREEVIEYIDVYKMIAVEEMQKYGIPASIKMAQAILESNAGMSDLATEANNHFGIKCGGEWNGPTYFKKDDDRDRQGRLIKSCFRVFRDAEDSFRAHSQFLLDPKKSYRYGPLFEIQRTDYKSWAWGLSKAGYATNPAYANLLIHLIEKYALYTYDYYEDSNINFINPVDVVVQARDLDFMEKLDKKSDDSEISMLPKPETRPSKEYKVEINDRKAIKVVEGQTMEQLAQKYDLTSQEILRYNDNDLGLDDYLENGMYVFLEKKRIWYRGPEKYHIVREGEDLHRISQMYGIRVSTLERKNKIKANMIPLPGQKIVLRGKAAKGDMIPLTYDDVEVVETNLVSRPILASEWQAEYQSDNRLEGTDNPEDVEKMNAPPTDSNDFSGDGEIESPIEGQIEKLKFAENVNHTEEPVQKVDFEKKDIVLYQEAVVEADRMETKEPSAPGTTHTYKVIKGDTLFSISRKFGVTVQSIRDLNQLTSDQISIDQILKIAQ